MRLGLYDDDGCAITLTRGKKEKGDPSVPQSVVEPLRELCARGNMAACDGFTEVGEWLREACDAGSVLACADLIRLGDESAAVGPLRKACAESDVKACSEIIRMGGGNSAVEPLRSACENGERYGCNSLALALAGLRYACDENSHLKSCANLGIHLMEFSAPQFGESSAPGPADVADAEALLQKACDGGEILGCNGLLPKEVIELDNDRVSEEWGRDTAGVELRLEELERSVIAKRKRRRVVGLRGGDTTKISYRLRATGFPADKAYLLWGWVTPLFMTCDKGAKEGCEEHMMQNFGSTDVVLVPGYFNQPQGLPFVLGSASVGESGDVLLAPATKAGINAAEVREWSFQLFDFSLGETAKLAMISMDNTVRGYTNTIPHPIEVREGNCSLTLQLLTSEGLAFGAMGEGFVPGEEVTVISQNNKEIMESEQPATSDGRVLTIIAAGVSGRSSGTGRLALTGRECNVTVDYDWGPPAIKPH
jgi:hypothetical protein